jgi:hypothetical protein
LSKISGITGQKQVTILDGLGGDPKIILARAWRSAGLLHGGRQNAESCGGMLRDLKGGAGLHLSQIGGADGAFGRIGARLPAETEFA